MNEKNRNVDRRDEIYKEMVDAKEKKKNEKNNRVNEERARIDVITKKEEDERIRIFNEKNQEKNKKWDEYQEFLLKKEKEFMF